MKRNINLTEGDIRPLLVKLTLPMLWGMLSMTIFNLTDTFFIGQLGKKELAAMSFTFPVVTALNSFAFGLGVGASAVISVIVGEGNRKEVKRLATHAMLLGCTIGCIIAATGEMTITPLFRILGAEEDLLPLITEYMQIWYIGFLFVVIPMIGNNIIRATGDMRTPGLIMSVIAVINICLDPILIFGVSIIPQLGITGAAIATVISRAIGMLFICVVLIKREKLILFTLPKITFMFHSWGKILHIGIPTATSYIIIPFATGVITRMISSYGAEAVAGFGVGTRLEMMAMMVVMALASVLVPFIGQNSGGRKFNRINQALTSGYMFSILWGAGIFLFFYFTGKFLGKLFNEDEKIIEAVVLYLNIVGIGYGLQGCVHVAASALNALKRPLLAMTLALVRMFILNIPLSYFCSLFLGLKGIFLGITLSLIITGTGAILIVRRMVRLNSL